MANTIRLKRGTTTPAAGNLVTGELAIDTSTGSVYTKTDAGSVVNVAGTATASWGGISGTLSSQTDLNSALGLKANLAGATFTGGIVTAAPTTAGAFFNLPHGAQPTTPVNGDVFTTTSGLFARINGSTLQFAAINSNTTNFGGTAISFGSSTAASTIGVGTGATISGVTKTVNLGTGGATGSITAVNIGSSTSTTTVTVSGALNNDNTVTLGNFTFTGAVNLGTGATQSGNIKTVNLGTGGVGGSTTNITLGPTLGTSTITMNGTVNAPGLVNGVKAWVNFNGVTNGTWTGGTSTVSRTAGSTTATITTTTAHGLVTGNTVYALTGVVAGIYAVTVLTATTFTITTAATTVLTAASITFAITTIKASYNVSSVVDQGVGVYTVNFATPMIDTNYACVATNCNNATWIQIFPSSNANGVAPAIKGTGAVCLGITAGAGFGSASYDSADISVAIFR